MNQVEIDFHYLRQLVQDKVVTLFYCIIDYQLIDIFMKPLSKVKFIKFCSLLGIQEDAIMGGCT